MRHLKISRYIGLLYREGTIWERKPLLSDGLKETRGRQWIKRLILLGIAIVVSININQGFNKEFIGYTISGLSIFIGLFINLIIILYQKFIVVKAEGPPKGPDLNKELNIKKVKNFIRQFTFVTGKNLLVATLIIMVSSVISLFPKFFETDTNTFSVVKTVRDVHCENLIFFKDYLLLVGSRIIIIYLLIDYFLLLLYSIGALFAFLKGEYND